MKTEIKTAEGFLRSKGLLSNDKTIFQITFRDESSVTVNELLDEYADQFKPKWNTFVSDRRSDPEIGEMIIYVCQYNSKQPCVIKWDEKYQVMEGDIWMSFKPLLP